MSDKHQELADRVRSGTINRDVFLQLLRGKKHSNNPRAGKVNVLVNDIIADAILALRPVPGEAAKIADGLRAAADTMRAKYGHHCNEVLLLADRVAALDTHADCVPRGVADVVRNKLEQVRDTHNLLNSLSESECQCDADVGNCPCEGCAAKEIINIATKALAAYDAAVKGKP